MAFYNPQQLQWLQMAVRSNPALLPQLYSSFNQVQPIDPAQTDQFANNARDTYLRNVINPQVAQAAVAGGATDNSFAASMRAALAAQGAAQAQSVWNNAFNQQNANQEALQSYNQNASDAAYGGFMNAYGPQEAKVAASRPSQFAMMGMQSPQSYLYGYSGMSPMQRFGSIGSGLFNLAPYALGGLSSIFGGGQPPAPQAPPPTTVPPSSPAGPSGTSPLPGNDPGIPIKAGV